MATVTLTTFVASSLHQDIVDGKFAAGERLPSEGDLATRFDVSRTVIRDATKLLVGQNVLSMERGKGVYVRQVAPLTTVTLPILSQASIRNLYETRRALEVAVVKLAVVRGTRADLTRLRRDVDRAYECIQKGGDVTKLLQYDEAFHRGLALATRNEVLLQLLDDLRHLLVMARLRSLAIEGRPQQSVGEHERILQAIEQRDLDGAEAAIYIHLTSVEATLVRDLP